MFVGEQPSTLALLLNNLGKEDQCFRNNILITCVYAIHEENFSSTTRWSNTCLGSVDVSTKNNEAVHSYSSSFYQLSVFVFNIALIFFRLFFARSAIEVNELSISSVSSTVKKAPETVAFVRQSLVSLAEDGCLVDCSRSGAANHCGTIAARNPLACMIGWIVEAW